MHSCRCWAFTLPIRLRPSTTPSLELLVVVGLIAFFILVRLSLSVEKPGPFSSTLPNSSPNSPAGKAEQVIGHGYERYQAYVTCIFFLSFSTTSSGLSPACPRPQLAGRAALAWPFLFSSITTSTDCSPGLIGYLKQFAGPIWWMAWLLFPIELISHFARIMSLTIRLWANMYASDLVTLVFFSLIPFAFPLFFSGCTCWYHDPGIYLHAS